MVRAFEARRSLPSFEQSFRGRTPRASEVLRRDGEKVSRRDPEALGVCSQMARQEVQGARSIASGQRLVCDRGRGSSGGFAGFGATRPSLWEVVLPGGQARGPVSHPRSGALLSSASTLRNLSRSGALLKVRRAAPGQLFSVREEEQSECDGPEGLTRKGAKYTVRSTSPLRRFVLGFLETESETGGGTMYAEPRSRWGTRSGDGPDTQGEIPGKVWRCKQSREDVDRKVRTEQ